MSASRNALLASVQRQRRERTRPATIGGEDTYGFMSMMVPEADYYILIARFPDLNSPDQEEQKRAWQRFARSPLSEPYRVDDSIGKRQRNTGIIVK